MTPRRHLLPAVQGNVAKADPLWERSEAMAKKALGPEHVGVAQMLIARAYVLETKVTTDY